MSKDKLLKLATSYTDEGLRSAFGLPQDLSIRNLESSGIVKRTSDGMWELNGADQLNRLENFHNKKLGTDTKAGVQADNDYFAQAKKMLGIKDGWSDAVVILAQRLKNEAAAKSRK